MGKTVVKSYVLELEAGNANINKLRSTDLGSLGINLEEFCSKYNSVTSGASGRVSVTVYVYEDGTYSFGIDSIEEEKVADNKPVNYSSPSSGSSSGAGSRGTTRSTSGSTRTQNSNAKTPNKNASTGQKTVGVNYSGVLSSVNDIINSINTTSSLQGNIKESLTTSTSSIFDSISSGGNYLNNVSSNLLYQISLGMNNVGTMLDNFKITDANLAKIASGLNNGLKQGLFGSPSSTISTDKIQSFESIVKSNTTLFDDNISIGKAGKIAVSELTSLIKKQTDSLNSEISDASKMNTSLSNLINSSDIQGSGWDAFKNILNKYKDCNETRSNAAQTLLDAYEEAKNKIIEYISPDEEMDDGEIPEYEETIAKLEREIADCESKIASLKSEIARLSSIQPKTVYTKTKEGKKSSKLDYSEYNAAQARIAANNQ